MNINADRFHPIVVKEVRQGLKARSFAVSLLALQTLMVIAMVAYLLAAGDGNYQNLQFVDITFWFLIGVVLMLILPLRALRGIRDEKKALTLELLALTRLSSWDIVLGKWLALVLQLVLLLVSLLPFIVLRYFFGRIDIAVNLVSLGLIALNGTVLIALGLAASGWSSKLLRGAVMVWTIMGSLSMPALLAQFARALPGSMAWTLEMWGFGLVVMALITGYLLVYAASVISPPAENHARTKRMIALGLLGLYCTLLVAYGNLYGNAVSLIFLILVCIDALCEPLHLIPALYRPRRRRVPLLLRRFFYPGWPSGLRFVLLMIGILVVIGLLTGGGHEQVRIFPVALTGTLLLPLAMILAVRSDPRNLITPYLVIQVVLFVLAMILFVLANVLDWKALGTMIPMSVLIASLGKNSLSAGGFVVCALITAVSLIIVLGRAIAPWQRIRVMETDA